MPKVTVERLDHQMRGIGKIDGKIVFIPKTLPEEIIDTEIVLEKKKFLEGKINNIIVKSKDRKESICPHFDYCGGCQLLHINYLQGLKYKQNKVCDIISKYTKLQILINDIVVSENHLFYRNKITLQVNNTIGYFKEKTNTIIPIDTCYIADKKINTIYKIVQDNISVSNINQIIIKSSNRTDESMAIFKTSGKIDECSIIENLKELVSSIYINDKLIFGKNKITEELLGSKFYISPTSFFQVNTEQAEKLYQIAIDYANISKNDLVLDLYCGTGTIGILASKYAKKVVGIELNKEAINDANLNKELNNISNIEFYAGDVGEILNRNNYKPDIVIVDPPRAGLDYLAVSEIIKIKPKRLVYVSCDLMTLARDLERLSEHFNIDELTPVDMFPQTSHVETVVALSRR